MKIVGITLLVIGGLIVLSAVGSVLNLVTIPWLTFNSKVQTNRDIVTKTYNADNALYNYHWFQERSGQIKAAEQNTKAANDSLISFENSAGSRDKWTFEDKTQDNTLRQVLLGSTQYYNNLVNEYNAHASEVDRSIFQDGLPLFFNLK